ncbi:hypothetical protein RND81_02G014500 [Saponaria officinalis]|uniref:DNA-directed RNA polymerase III subunit RPC9 n=1 Tax=Saponaria officinalis TaxID=3572 RepID=A0AAW1MPY3_SAPOF
MKILKFNAGPLTNFEVYDFLQKKGASTDPAQRIMITKIRPSELQVFDYLVGRPACNQTRESINEFMEKCKEFDLVKVEMVNIINTRPTDIVEIVPCIEKYEERMDDDRLQKLQDMVDSVLPPPPPRNSDVEAAMDDSDQATDEETPDNQMDTT